MRTKTKVRRPKEAELPVSRDEKQVREIFRGRLNTLRSGLGLKQGPFAELVKVPRATIDSWEYESTRDTAGIQLFHVRSIALRAKHPEVKLGRISVDWLCGLTDEPDMDKRTKVGDLPVALAEYVGDAVSRRVGKDEHGNLRRDGFRISGMTYWLIDGKAIIERAIGAITKCFEDASNGLPELQMSHRKIIQGHAKSHPAAHWPQPGTNAGKRQAVTPLEEEAHRKAMTANLSRALIYAEYVRRINTSNAPLIFREELFNQRP